MEWRHIYSIASAGVVLLAVVLMSLCSLSDVSDLNEGMFYKTEGQIEVYTGVCDILKTELIIQFISCDVMQYKFA